ncbi:MAG: O-antigen ligase family protein [Bacteroidales bacterium]|nr:O-antigen ligase family protein [Bacteroidales bacterium]
MEIILVIYLLSGIIKGYINYFSLGNGIDLTFLLAIFLFVLYFLVFDKKNIQGRIFKFPTPVLILLIFWGWMMFTLLYTGSKSYAYIKVFNFATNIVPLFLILHKTDFNIKLFLKWYVIGVIILVIAYFPMAIDYYITWNKSKGDFTRMYLTLGENIGFVILTLYFTKEKLFGKNGDLVLLISSFIMLFAIGARGPLFFVIIIIIISFLLKRKHKLKLSIKTSTLMVILSLIFIVIIIALFNWELVCVFFKNAIFRMQTLFNSVNTKTNKIDPSVGLRITLFFDAIKIIFSDIYTFMFGTGVGSFGMDVNGVDSNLHPHNQILEIWVELGLIGLMIYLYFFFFLIIKVNINYLYISSFIIVFALLNLLKSSSLIEIRIPLSFIALNLINNNSASLIQRDEISLCY